MLTRETRPTIHDVIRSQAAVDDRLDGRDLEQIVANLLRTMTYRERTTLELRFGIGDGLEYTRAECGRIFGVSAARIRQIENKALRKLRHWARGRHLARFVPVDRP
ncbi:MAG: hypothetical protein JSS49_27440 [Planctomycetes bacterium]|nr:hypothetical protein [Planctomycetota bacterium]